MTKTQTNTTLTYAKWIIGIFFTVVCTVCATAYSLGSDNTQIHNDIEKNKTLISHVDKEIMEIKKFHDNLIEKLNIKHTKDIDKNTQEHTVILAQILEIKVALARIEEIIRARDTVVISGE